MSQGNRRGKKYIAKVIWGVSSDYMIVIVTPEQVQDVLLRLEELHLAETTHLESSIHSRNQK